MADEEIIITAATADNSNNAYNTGYSIGYLEGKKEGKREAIEQMMRILKDGADEV